MSHPEIITLTDVAHIWDDGGDIGLVASMVADPIGLDDVAAMWPKARVLRCWTAERVEDDAHGGGWLTAICYRRGRLVKSYERIGAGS